MSNKVAKWKTCIVRDLEAGIEYTFEDDKGISLNAWRRYLSRRFGTASGPMMAEGRGHYDTVYKDCVQIGRLEQ